MCHAIHFYPCPDPSSKIEMSIEARFIGTEAYTEELVRVKHSQVDPPNLESKHFESLFSLLSPSLLSLQISARDPRALLEEAHATTSRWFLREAGGCIQNGCVAISERVDEVNGPIRIRQLTRVQQSLAYRKPTRRSQSMGPT